VIKILTRDKAICRSFTTIGQFTDTSISTRGQLDIQTMLELVLNGLLRIGSGRVFEQHMGVCVDMCMIGSGVLDQFQRVMVRQT
jgi:hypothetical protein